MNTVLARANLESAILRGTATGFCFDWDKAARLIRERNPKKAVAGLANDLEWTGGVIYRDGLRVEDSYTYLASKWCRAVLVLDDEEIDCTIAQNECEWDSGTKWPESAIKILEGK